MAGYEKLAGFRPGPDMISGATLLNTRGWFTNICADKITRHSYCDVDAEACLVSLIVA